MLHPHTYYKYSELISDISKALNINRTKVSAALYMWFFQNDINQIGVLYIEDILNYMKTNDYESDYLKDIKNHPRLSEHFSYEIWKIILEFLYKELNLKQITIIIE